MSGSPPRAPAPTEPPQEHVAARTQGRATERSRRSQFAGQVTAPVARMLRIDETAGWPLIIASVVALLWANLGSGSYDAVWTAEISLSLGPWSAETALRDLVNSVLLPSKPQTTLVYVAVGASLWIALSLAGVHATVAGVALGLMIPVRPLFAPEEVADRADPLVEGLRHGSPRVRPRLLGRLEELVLRSESPAERSARVLTPAVSYFVLPVFGLAMAGTSMSPDAWASLGEHAAALGVLAGLLVGKPVGVLLFTWIGVRSGLTSLPAGLTWRHLTAVTVLAGIGFTVSLFIARLGMVPADLDVVKLAILLASTVSAVVGVSILATSPTVEESG